MAGKGKLAAILFGLLGALCTAGSGRGSAQALPGSTPSSQQAGTSSAQAPQEQVSPVYPQTEDGFKAQMDTAVEAYRKGDTVAGRRLLEQFRMPQADQWFAENFGPERGATLAKRYARLFEEYLKSTEKTLEGLANAKGRKLETNLKPGTRESPQERPGILKLSGMAPVKDPICFNGNFFIRMTGKAKALLTGDYRAEMWTDTFVYQDGAFRFLGHGGWPFWIWDRSLGEKVPEGG